MIDELQATEGGEIPTVIDGESMDEQTYDTWSVHSGRKKTPQQTPGQITIFDYPNGFQGEPAVSPSRSSWRCASTDQRHIGFDNYGTEA